MNLGDPELELVDPTPNIHSLFLHFDKLFFWARLSSRAVVRWSKRMYSCAGICSYDRGGLCDIALSEPLLKLRSRKDVVETLLHEMIHAFLFITKRDIDRDGHGPNFKAHMHRINQAAGLNISIYHDFHEEVKLYQTHWWRCNGPCQNRRPHFGIVRRSMNRAPGPSDYWWDDHKKKCGGIFQKIKEPEKQQNKKRISPKPNTVRTQYIHTEEKGNKVAKPILKESNIVSINTNIVKSNNHTIVVSKKNNIVFNPQATKTPNKFIPTGKGEILNKSIISTVRTVWTNKTLPTLITNNNNQDITQNTAIKTTNVNTSSPNSNKHKADDTQLGRPLKIKKIDDYFKSVATSLLKDVYGQDFEIKEVNINKRLSIVPVNSDLVDCPVCSSKINSNDINKHLDECLNKEIIENISKESPVIAINSEIVNDNKLIVPKIKKEPAYYNNEKEIDLNANVTDQFIASNKEKNNILDTNETIKQEITIKIEPGTSKEELKCPCCDKLVINMDQHLDECLAFFNNNTTIPTESASTSYSNDTIIIDDDDIFDETLMLNATGTKTPCPCCLKMIEQYDMNDHLDVCLS